MGRVKIMLDSVSFTQRFINYDMRKTMDRNNRSGLPGPRPDGKSCRPGASIPAGITTAILAGVLVLSGCGGPKAGTVYEPSRQEEDLSIDMTAVEAARLERENKELPQAEITESGYTVTEIDESDVYPPVKTDDNGNALPAYLVNYAVRISNKGNDRAMIRPTIVVRVNDANGERISKSSKTFRTYILPDEEIAVAGDMIVHGAEPSQITFTAECEDPEVFYPTEEELRIPGGDSYSASDVTVEVLEEYAQKAPSAGRESSEGMSKGYFRLGELPALSGRISCNSGEDREAFVTILFKDGDEILGGETGRVMIPAGKEAFYTFSAPGPIPEDTDQYEVSAFSIARF
jgi:hypothetical protein